MKCAIVRPLSVKFYMCKTFLSDSVDTSCVHFLKDKEWSLEKGVNDLTEALGKCCCCCFNYYYYCLGIDSYIGCL